MFNDQSSDQHGQNNTDMDQVAQDISGAPAFGLGHNPSSFNPVLPSQQDSSSPVAVDTGTQDDSSTVPVSTPSMSMSAPAQDSPAPTVEVPAELNDIKTKALEQLSPLVNKLDQSPEDRYKTLMMLIQASDNQDLLKEAYEAANQIADEQLKAEALLGVVNEINYFSAKQQG